MNFSLLALVSFFVVAISLFEKPEFYAGIFGMSSVLDRLMGRSDNAARQELAAVKEILRKDERTSDFQPLNESDEYDIIVDQDEIPELHRVFSKSVDADDDEQNKSLPTTGSVRQMIIEVDTSSASVTGGTSNSLVSRAADLALKAFTLNFNDSFFGSKELIKGQYALMALREKVRAESGGDDNSGEFVLDFPQQDDFNAMLPAGHRSADFSFDYAVDSASNLSDDGTSVTGIVVNITFLRYHTTYEPTHRLIFRNQELSSEFSSTGEHKFQKISDGQLIKKISYVMYDTNDALSDILDSSKLENDERTVSDIRPGEWRAWMNIEVKTTPSVGVIIHNFRTPLVSKNLRPIVDFNDVTDVEMYRLIESVITPRN